MTLGEKLLDLSTEYQQSVSNRNDWQAAFGGEPAGREPAVIAADYESALRELLA